MQAGSMRRQLLREVRQMRAAQVNDGAMDYEFDSDDDSEEEPGTGDPGPGHY